MTHDDDAARLILDHVTRALAVADLAGLTDVGINLNQTLIALGHLGIPPACSGPDEVPPLNH